MQLAEVKALCDQLREVIAAGPGKNELALQEAMGVVSMLQHACFVERTARQARHNPRLVEHLVQPTALARIRRGRRNLPAKLAQRHPGRGILLAEKGSDGVIGGLMTIA